MGAHATIAPPMDADTRHHHDRPAPRMPSRTEGALLLSGVALALIASLVVARDRMTWLMEVAWVIVALPWLALDRRVKPTRLLAWLLALHALVLIEGGAYTYAQAPLGEWLRDLLHTQRNPWDRVGHFMQGFVPAILAREVLLRRTPLRPGGWLTYLCIAAALSFSAFFELIEWWSALALGADADAFLATQGDVWDTQWDMFLCLCGAIASLVLLTRAHDRALGLGTR
jgi:putative membrane protein